MPSTDEAQPAEDFPTAGWRSGAGAPSLPESHRSMAVPVSAGFLRKLMAFTGPGFLVAVGYMDPGNWATDLAGGAQYNYTLLCVIVFSNFLAILLQSLALKLGIATGRDLAQACRDHYSRPVAFGLWMVCEAAIAACDLAEVIGSAIALNLLFHIPVVWGVCITSMDVLIILAMQGRGFRFLEILVVGLIATVGGCFAVEIFYSHADWPGVALGFLPDAAIVKDRHMLYLALGILGATVMPHNLYLHSSIVQTRRYALTSAGRKDAIRFANIDSAFALMFALGVNAAILIVAAATFYRSGHHEVADISDAYKLLTPLLGASGAGIIFAVALLASGQNSTLTGTLAGQIVMEGFLNFRIQPWLRRLITRLIAVVPAVIVTVLYGERGTGQLLVLSQVILSLQLSFAVIPLVIFTSDRRKMGEFVNGTPMKIGAWATALLIAGLNIWLLVQTVHDWLHPV